MYQSKRINKKFGFTLHLFRARFKRNKSNALHKGAGFTLIELLAGMAIFVVLFGTLTTFIVWVYRSNVKFQALSEVSTNTQRATQIIIDEVRSASSVYLPTTNATQLSLETSRYQPAGETLSFVDFFICDTQLCMKKETDTSPVAITSNKVQIDSLDFDLLSNDDGPYLVQITLVVSYKQSSGALEEQAQTSITSTAILRSY